MPARVFKYDLEVTHRQMIQMPPGQALDARIQGGLLKLWVLHSNPQAQVETRIFRLVTTGEEFNADGCEHIATFEAEGWFIGHVFEQLSEEQADVVSVRFKNDFRQINRELSEVA